MDFSLMQWSLPPVESSPTSHPQLKRSYNDAFRTLDETECLELEIYASKAKVVKTSYEQRCQDVFDKLWHVTLPTATLYHFVMKPGKELRGFMADLTVYRCNKYGEVLFLQEFKGELSFNTEDGAKREVCDMALHWALYEEPLCRAFYRQSTHQRIEALAWGVEEAERLCQEGNFVYESPRQCDSIYKDQSVRNPRTQQDAHYSNVKTTVGEEVDNKSTTSSGIPHEYLRRGVALKRSFRQRMEDCRLKSEFHHIPSYNEVQDSDLSPRDHSQAEDLSQKQARHQIRRVGRLQQRQASEQH
ncbi:hypothetical protein EG329_004043 [Mollisiaceae sp. DMI_Dod_QoI]|nr:hypothetical protein EG329_004043 [Helotiales sp. DMI_Dod_QoI]